MVSRGTRNLIIERIDGAIGTTPNKFITHTDSPKQKYRISRTYTPLMQHPDETALAAKILGEKTARDLPPFLLACLVPRCQQRYNS